MQSFQLICWACIAAMQRKIRSHFPNTKTATYQEIARICTMPDKSPQLTWDFLDDFAATEENLQLEIYKFI